LSLWVVAVAALMAGFVKSSIGVGGGILPTALLATVVHAPLAVATLGPVQLVSSLGAVASGREHIAWSEVVRMVPAALLGLAAGTFLLVEMPDRWLTFALGILAIAIGIRMVLRAKSSRRVAHKTSTGWPRSLAASSFGLLGGIMSGLAHSGGLVMTVYLAAVQLDKKVFVATLMAVVCAVDIAKIFAYLGSGLLPDNWLMVIVVSIPAVIVGTFVGRRANHRMSPEFFRSVLGIAVILFGVPLIAESL
jgi:uncharacterized protein